MYRVLMLIMLKDIWRYVKKEKYYILWYLILAFLIHRNLMFLLEIKTGKIVLDYLEVTELKRLILVCFLFLLMFFIVPMRGVPLRICKGLYVCPVEECEKVRYLKGMLGVKVVSGMILTGLGMKYLIGTAFWKGDIWFTIILYVLCFFTLVNVNLNLRMGDTGERRVDENGYVIQTKTEIVIKVYWLCVLIVQWVILFADIEITMAPVVRGCIWGTSLLINLFFVKEYVGEFLKEILLYENVYCPRPKREGDQYDIC